MQKVQVPPLTHLALWWFSSRYQPGEKFSRDMLPEAVMRSAHKSEPTVHSFLHPQYTWKMQMTLKDKITNKCKLPPLKVNVVVNSSGEQRKMEETSCEVTCGAPIAPAVKGWVKVKAKQNNVCSQWNVLFCPTCRPCAWRHTHRLLDTK